MNKIVEKIKENWKRIVIDASLLGLGILVGHMICKKNNNNTNVGKKNFYYKHDKYYKK
jgi:hypothetical protein